MEETLGDFDAGELKRADRMRSLTYTVGLMALEFIGMFLMFFLLGYIGLIIMFVLAFFFFPTPYPTIPTKYNVSNGALTYNDRTVSNISPKFKIKSNTKRMFVSIKHPRRGEVLRLYTKEPEKLMQTLEKMIQKIGTGENRSEQHVE